MKAVSIKEIVMSPSCNFKQDILKMHHGSQPFPVIVKQELGMEYGVIIGGQLLSKSREVLGEDNR